MKRFLTGARALSDGVNTAAIAVCIFCVLAMLAISFTGFLYTLFTGGALSWTYSLARLFLPWIGLLSSTVALHSGEHVAMTLLMRVLPDWGVRIAAGLSMAILALFGLALVVYGWDFFSSARQIYMVSDSIQVSYKFTTIAVPITGVIILLHLAQGFSLLEHYLDEDELIDSALDDAEQEGV
ncbi:TRAP transporter [Saccharospirillum sp. MSK14-1]|uniref:TRAP transporter small permease n=1 Tax=Saccharospirillum sp. MSK14-1 TaxID=1897632 RepID=UPI000D45A5B8|nr:TRAP transporter small permease subunit [Saccharospirillum sp. MSK14-1]PTY38687.1 TRAP transporter [Saccharospirillum sp. MSK14-1]